MYSLSQVPSNLRDELHQVVSNIFTGQNAQQFLIRLLATEEEKSQAMLLISELLREDPIMRAFGFDELSENSLTEWIQERLNQNITYGYFTYDGDQLVAVDCLYVRHIYDNFEESTAESGQPFRNFKKYVGMIERRIWHLSGKKKCKYLTSFGMFTSPAHRNIGIPSDMVRIRSRVARSLRIEITGSAFIGNEMLEAAKTYRYKNLQTFYGPEDMSKVGLDFDFGNIFPIKIMAIYFRI